jgi:predicted membrane metal-binding protein
MRDPTRIDLLFTMSEITHAATLVRMDNMRSDVSRTTIWLRVAAGARPVFALRATPGTLRLFSCVAAPRVAKGEAWWSQTGSNRRPHACKARALPAELWPRNQKTKLTLE